MSKDYRVESYATVDGPRELVKTCGTLQECHAAIAKAIGQQYFKSKPRRLPSAQGCLERYARFIGPYAKVDKSGFMIFGPASQPAKSQPSETVIVDKTVWEALLKVTQQIEGRLGSIEANLDANKVVSQPQAATPLPAPEPEPPKRNFLGRHRHDGTFFGQIDAALLGAVEQNPGVIRTRLIEAARLDVGGCSSSLLFARLKGLVSQHKVLATEDRDAGVPVFRHYLPHQLGKGQPPSNGAASV